MIKTILLNGEITSLDKVSLGSFMEGFSYGAGLFETFLIESGSPLLLNRHLNRLKGSLEHLKKHITCPAQEFLLEGAVRQMIQRALKEGPDLGSNFTGIGKIIASDGQLLIQFRHLPPIYQTRLTEGVVLDQYKNHFYRKGDMTLNHKLLNYFKQFMYIQENILFVNEFNEICESPTANIFLEIGNRIVTPPLDAPCLPGTVRDVLLTEKAFPNLVEACLPMDDMDKVKGGFLTNSVYIAVPIRSIFGKILETSESLAESVRKVVQDNQ